MVKEFVTERLKLIDLYPDKAKSVAKEYGLKEDEVELIRKGRVSSQPVIDRDARTVINYISTDAIDRDNEVIEHRGVVLEDYMKNPIVPWAHDYHGLPIGKNLWIKPDRKGLVAKTYFLRHDFAENVFDLYTEDIKGTGPALNAWSVGFIPLKWKDAKNGDKDIPQDERPQKVRRTYKKWLLLEYSAVPVPSNPEALTLMVEKGLIKDDKLKKDIEDFIIEIDKAKYECECIKCGWKTESDKHCKDLKCEECGGQMRRVERPGPGQESIDDKLAKDIILKPEEDDDEIRLPVKGEEGKHKKHKIRWITVSEEKGIKGLYCIDCKKIITYVFDKAKGWTMAKALKWMKDNGKQIEARIKDYIKEGTDFEEMQDLLELDDENRQFVELINDEVKGVIPFSETAKAPEGEKWDAGREVRAAEVSDLRVMCTWFDSENPDTKGAYKLPHHKADGHAVVWRAVAAAMAALLGARGGVAIPSGDKKGVYNHLVKEYARFDKEPPELREYDEQKLKDIFNEDTETGYTLNIKMEMENEIADALEELQQEVRDLKEGRVLSGKNLKLVKDCREQMSKAVELLDKLIVASEPPKEESILPLITESKKNDNKTDIDSLTKKDIPVMMEELLKGLKEGMLGQRKEMQDLIDSKTGKIR